jgi:hypothetical protein
LSAGITATQATTPSMISLRNVCLLRDRFDAKAGAAQQRGTR